jgi:hypothetical protein
MTLEGICNIPMWRHFLLNFPNLVISCRLLHCCSRIFGGTLFWNDMKWSAHGVLEQCLVYQYIYAFNHALLYH